MPIYKGIKDLAHHLKISKTELAKRLGMSYSTVHAIVNKKQERSVAFEKAVSHHLPHINIQYLNTQEGEIELTQTLIKDGDTYSINLESLADQVSEPIEIYSKKDRLLQIDNDIMSPVINHGDRLVLQAIGSKIDIVQNEIYVLETNQYGTICRRLRFLSDDSIFILSPENHKYETLKLSAEEIACVWKIRMISKK